MKILHSLFLFALIGGASGAMAASIIDNAVSSYKNVVVIDPITYNGLPVGAQGLMLCEFLGYKLALNEHGKIVTGKMYSFFSTGAVHAFREDDGDNWVLDSLTCAR